MITAIEKPNTILLHKCWSFLTVVAAAQSGGIADCQHLKDVWILSVGKFD